MLATHDIFLNQLVFLHAASPLPPIPVGQWRHHEPFLRPQVLELVVEVDIGDGNNACSVVVDVIRRIGSPVEARLMTSVGGDRTREIARGSEGVHVFTCSLRVRVFTCSRVRMFTCSRVDMFTRFTWFTWFTCSRVHYSCVVYVFMGSRVHGFTCSRIDICSCVHAFLHVLTSCSRYPSFLCPIIVAVQTQCFVAAYEDRPLFLTPKKKCNHIWIYVGDWRSASGSIPRSGCFLGAGSNIITSLYHERQYGQLTFTDYVFGK